MFKNFNDLFCYYVDYIDAAFAYDQNEPFFVLWFDNCVIEGKFDLDFMHKILSSQLFGLPKAALIFVRATHFASDFAQDSYLLVARSNAGEVRVVEWKEKGKGIERLKVPKTTIKKTILDGLVPIVS